MDSTGDICSSENCSTAEDKLSLPYHEIADWFPEHPDLLDDSSFFELALAETTKKRRKLGEAEDSNAKEVRSFKRDLAKKRKVEPRLYKLKKQELEVTTEQAECDVKKHHQMIRNRVSAQQSRDRKKAQMVNLEQENAKLLEKLNAIETEQTLLKSTLAKLDRSKLSRVLKGASMTMATFLSVCILVNSLHSSKDAVTQLAQQLEVIDLELYRDETGASLFEKSASIFQDLLGGLALTPDDLSDDPQPTHTEVDLASLNQRSEVTSPWLDYLPPKVSPSQLATTVSPSPSKRSINRNLLKTGPKPFS
jgi:hypothetical protein